MRRATEIIQYALNLRQVYNTRNPFKLAGIFGIETNFSTSNNKDFTARTIKFPNYPTIININSAFNEPARIALCAHELGHALLHNDSINHFATTKKNAFSNVEYEANLFAVALLFDKTDFNIPIDRMSNYTLKSILDYNIRYSK